ncbi:hypothetical protein A1sIIB76_05925 [Candidatus Planktophila versatilis]|uniref:Uncharacterized protein n=1 Tax=Candidatus Planktophila versatilis TaxID=1884905 RepID=A0AAD0E7C6_9ACTN|nr:hypothetical protein [Candidatus Planktophila versatilis]ASY23066.1 hypothetical protein A1sIIB76_05925 [Candidatus Planktophila versatilis]
MKRIALLLVISITLMPTAEAVQKKVAVKKVTTVLSVPGAEMLAVSGSSIITIATVDSQTTDIVLSAVNGTGVSLWQKVIDSGVDEVAMATTVDGAANVWLAGFSSQVKSASTETASVIAENPDAITLEAAEELRGDLNVLTVWKISPAGELLATYTSQYDLPGLINSISVNKSGLSIVGVLSEKPFLQNMSAAGEFSQQASIGTSKTTINTVVRNSDGSSSLFGSSTETLGGKKLAGVRDGVLVKTSKSGAIASVVRSSAIKGDRSWLSADSSLLLSGYVKVGKTTETAITKFTSTFVPTWTIRFASTGQSRAITGAGISYAAMGSKSAIASITGWKPSKAQLLVVVFDAKGVMTSAFGSSELSEPLALAYSKDLGIVGLALNADQSPAVFRIAAR